MITAVQVNTNFIIHTLGMAMLQMVPSSYTVAACTAMSNNLTMSSQS